MFKWFGEILFPYYCAVCGQRSHQGIDLCQNCKESLIVIDQACYVCGQPLVGLDKKTAPRQAICGKCLNKPPLFDHTLAPYRYQGLMRQLIIHLKFFKQLYYARVLSQLLLEKLLPIENAPEIIIPMPLHRRRICERGFNQALEIAKFMSKKTKIPVSHYHLCQRIRETKPQSSLTLNLRQQNVANAFLVTKTLPQRVAIVDDVITTGATINQLSVALRKKGVKYIQVWCCAKA